MLSAAFLLSGCFLTREPVFTTANSIEPAESAKFNSFLEAARLVADNVEKGEVYGNVPLGNPPIDLRIVSVPGSDMIIVQEFAEGLGNCTAKGCYIYYGVRLSKAGRPERCFIKLGFLESESDKAPITKAARSHNVELTALVDNLRVQGYSISGSKHDIASFILEQFSHGQYDCVRAITGGSGLEIQ